MTVDEYLVLEETSLVMEHEYVDGDVYAMSGGTHHDLIANDVRTTIGSHSHRPVRIASFSGRMYAFGSVQLSPTIRMPWSFAMRRLMALIVS